MILYKEATNILIDKQIKEINDKEDNNKEENNNKEEVNNKEINKEKYEEIFTEIFFLNDNEEDLIKFINFNKLKQTENILKEIFIRSSPYLKSSFSTSLSSSLSSSLLSSLSPSPTSSISTSLSILSSLRILATTTSLFMEHFESVTYWEEAFDLLEHLKQLSSNEQFNSLLSSINSSLLLFYYNSAISFYESGDHLRSQSLLIQAKNILENRIEEIKEIDENEENKKKKEKLISLYINISLLETKFIDSSKRARRRREIQEEEMEKEDKEHVINEYKDEDLDWVDDTFDKFFNNDENQNKNDILNKEKENKEEKKFNDVEEEDEGNKWIECLEGEENNEECVAFYEIEDYNKDPILIKKKDFDRFMS